MSRKRRPKPERDDADGRELKVALDVPGAVCSVEEFADGVAVERNGAGSIVTIVFPWGIGD